jgi:hypothetical protein
MTIARNERQEQDSNDDGEVAMNNVNNNGEFAVSDSNIQRVIIEKALRLRKSIVALLQVSKTLMNMMMMMI